MKKEKPAIICQDSVRVIGAVLITLLAVPFFYFNVIDLDPRYWFFEKLIELFYIGCITYCVVSASKTIRLHSEKFEVCYFAIPIREVLWQDIRRVEFVEWRSPHPRAHLSFPVIVFELDRCPPAPHNEPKKVAKFLKNYNSLLEFQFYTRTKENHYIELLKQFYSGDITSWVKPSKSKKQK